MSPPHAGDGDRDLSRTTPLGRVLVALRWGILGFWALACLVSTWMLPTLAHAGGGGSLRGLLPDDTPALVTELRSVELFGFPLSGRTTVVQRDPDGMTPFAQARSVVTAVGATRHPPRDMGRLRGALPVTNALGAFPSSSEQGTTAMTYLLFDPDVSFSAQTRIAHRYAHRLFRPRDDVVGVTGSVPARAEQGHLIPQALPRAELLTLGAIVLIVGVAFRSVVAPVITLLTTGVAYVLTMRLSGWFAELFGSATPSELEPVIVALLLGVVTDYVVFYLAALRRELSTGADRLDAARAATSSYGPIVGVAGLAVASGTAALVFAESLFFRALGPALVFTVVVGMLVAFTLVPALMGLLGSVILWPSRPGPTTRPAADGRRSVDRLATLPRRVFAAIVGRRSVAGAVVLGSVAMLVLAASPVRGLTLGVSFIGALPSDSGVREAADSARDGFAPGILSPTTVLVEGDRLTDHPQGLRTLGELLESERGVAGVLGPGQLPHSLDRRILLTPDGTAARYLVVLDDPALGAAAIQSLEDLQHHLPELLARSGLTGATAGTAGDTATAAFIVDQTKDDLLRIAVAALLANLLMLVIFLRALVAALYLLVGTLLSLGAALGLTMLLFGHLDPGAGLTFYVPFAGAVLLLAFGSDYNIFAVGNIWEAARSRPLLEAVEASMPSIVAAILTAGLALAASFGLLSVVPLVPFRELAFFMFVGITLDVLVVRALLLPALLSLVGPVSAWPSRRFTRPAPTQIPVPARPSAPRRAATLPVVTGDQPAEP